MNIQIFNVTWLDVQHEDRNYKIIAGGDNGNSVEICQISYKYLKSLRNDIDKFIEQKPKKIK